MNHRPPSAPLTRIVATLGPATDSAEGVARLVEAGVRVFRLNFSHGELDRHAQVVERVRAVERDFGAPLAILGDLPGPKIRLAEVASEQAESGGGGSLELRTGESVRFVRGDGPCVRRADGVTLATNYPALIDDLDAGERVLIDDGAVRLLVTEVGADEARCTVLTGGPISRAKGVNLPDTNLAAPAVGARDMECLDWSVRHDIDLLALSFVRTADEIVALRGHVLAAAERASKRDFRMAIVAKIERPEAVENAASIFAASDGVMVARGDLGVELELWRVPTIQHQLLDLAGELGTPCIVATQMLQSMIEAPAPTRAEANDVATAIMQGTDAVMLSGETAVGKWPTLTVEVMARIATHTESYLADRRRTGATAPRVRERFYRTAAMAHGVWNIARDNRAACLAVWSQQGGGARYLSQNDLDIPIVACSSDLRALRRMQILRGVVPVAMEVPPSLAAWTDLVDALLQERGLVSAGDRVVLMAGAPLGKAGVTNCIALHEVGNRTTGFR